MSKRGVFTSNGVHVKVTELRAVEFFLANGYDVELVVPNNTPKNRNPDFIIMGKIWELKTPVTRNKTTISRKIRKGGQQAENLIVDLRYAKINERIAINTLQYNYRRSRRIKHILVISKTNQLLSLSKKKNKIQ